jgi:hypothetical protein
MAMANRRQGAFSGWAKRRGVVLGANGESSEPDKTNTPGGGEGLRRPKGPPEAR